MLITPAGIPRGGIGPRVKKFSFESRRSSSRARQLYILLPRNYKIDVVFFARYSPRALRARDTLTRAPELILSTFHTSEIKISISCEYSI